jgi:hypothetical protein
MVELQQLSDVSQGKTMLFYGLQSEPMGCVTKHCPAQRGTPTSAVIRLAVPVIMPGSVVQKEGRCCAPGIDDHSVGFCLAAVES